MESQREGNLSDNIIVYPFDDDHSLRIDVMPGGRIVWNKSTGRDYTAEETRQFAAGLIEAARIAEEQGEPITANHR